MNEIYYTYPIYYYSLPYLSGFRLRLKMNFWVRIVSHVCNFTFMVSHTRGKFYMAKYKSYLSCTSTAVISY